VGTDGAGKSTLAEQLTNQLSQYGYQTKASYFGRARGNLPGINWIREKVAVKFKEEKRSTSQGEYSEKSGRHEKNLKWLGSWYYAFEYAIRSILWAHIPRLKGKVVILDRYVYDLRIMPGASKTAIRMAERLSAKPDLLVFLHAPEKEILARKPERDLQTLKVHQATYQELIDTLEGSFWVGRVSTSEKSSAQPGEILIPEILTASHRLHIDAPQKSQSILKDE